MRWRRAVLPVACVAAGAFVTACLWQLWPLVEAGPAGFHQRSITREMASWEQEYRTLHDWREAWLAAGMLEYTQTYYVPGPGYRSNARIEAALEAQRARTLEAIAAGLRDFTGQDFGTDGARWREWLTREGHAEGR